MARNATHLGLRSLLGFLALALACVALPAAASAQGASANGGGASYVPPPPPAKKAKIHNGRAIPPRNAPRRVKRVIRAANRIVDKPYLYGGGHKPFRRIWRKLDRGYDCSGAISHALFGGRFLRSPLSSSGFMSWGVRGKGRWITVYTNPGHAYVVIAGLRLDTSSAGRSTRQERASGDGPRWRKYPRSRRGFRARHPRGF